jgi:hypothetical protein
LCRNQRLNLSLLAGGDCADWMRKQRFYRRVITPTTEHPPEVQVNVTSYHRQTPNRKQRYSQNQSNHANKNGSPSLLRKTFKHNRRASVLQCAFRRL